MMFNLTLSLVEYAYMDDFNPDDWKLVVSWIIDRPKELMVLVKTAMAIEGTPMEIPAEVDEEIKKMNALGQALGQTFGEG